MQKNSLDTTLYRSPFCGGFWKSAVREFKSVRSLVLAAMIIALRVAVKSFSIPIAENVFLGVDFLVNSVGSMIYGPVVGLLVGAVSDTIGAFLFPKGVYFFPFILVEMSSSFIFGLFLYRARLSGPRIILSRFTVTVVCNLLINPLIMKWNYIVTMGKDYAIFRWVRVVKNLCLFPLEALLLILWLGVISAVTYRMNLTYDKPKQEKLTGFNLVLIIFLTLLAVLLTALGILYYRMIK